MRAALQRGDHAPVIRRVGPSKCRALDTRPLDTGASPQSCDLEHRLRAVTERINRRQRVGGVPAELPGDDTVNLRVAVAWSRSA